MPSVKERLKRQSESSSGAIPVPSMKDERATGFPHAVRGSMDSNPESLRLLRPRCHLAQGGWVACGSFGMTEKNSKAPLRFVPAGKTGCHAGIPNKPRQPNSLYALSPALPFEADIRAREGHRFCTNLPRETKRRVYPRCLIRAEDGPVLHDRVPITGQKPVPKQDRCRKSTGEFPRPSVFMGRARSDGTTCAASPSIARHPGEATRQQAVTTLPPPWGVRCFQILQFYLTELSASMC